MDNRIGVDSLSPFDEMEMAELGVKQAELDEEAAMFDPDVNPRAPHPKEEGVTDMDGTRVVDMQEETRDVDLPNLRLDDSIDIFEPL